MLQSTETPHDVKLTEENGSRCTSSQWKYSGTLEGKHASTQLYRKNTFKAVLLFTMETTFSN